MTNWLTVVAKIFKYIEILLQFFFSPKNIKVFAIFQDRNFNVTLANNFIKFGTTGPCLLCNSVLIY